MLLFDDSVIRDSCNFGKYLIFLGLHKIITYIKTIQNIFDTFNSIK